MLIVSIIALIGFPFYSGFYSKDLIIEYYINYKINIILSIILDLRICITTIYAARLSYYICWNKSIKNISFNYSTSKYEKIVIIIFSIPIISSGAIISWIFSKNFNIEVPIPLYIKTFGLWGIIISLIIVIWINKTKLIIKKYYTWFIITIIFIDTRFLNIIKLILIIRNIYNNLREKIWNNFFRIIRIISFKNIIKNNKIFYPLNIIKNSIIIIIIIIILLIL